jgi:hypothetical protein
MHFVILKFFAEEAVMYVRKFASLSFAAILTLAGGFLSAAWLMESLEQPQIAVVRSEGIQVSLAEDAEQLAVRPDLIPQAKNETRRGTILSSQPFLAREQVTLIDQIDELNSDRRQDLLCSQRRIRFSSSCQISGGIPSLKS